MTDPPIRYEPPTFYVDGDRTVCLCDVGSEDYLAAVTVDPQGDTLLVLAHRDALHDPASPISLCHSVAHEQLGPLPMTLKARVVLAPLRCGRPTKSGGRCRIIVTTAGHACHHHTDTPKGTRDD